MYGVKITMFVTARNVEDKSSRRLLEDWSSAGHAIANHTYSHFALNSPQHLLAEFQDDVLRAERILAGVKNYEHMFRFPALKEGDTAESRDGMRAFLDAHAYHSQTPLLYLGRNATCHLASATRSQSRQLTAVHRPYHRSG